MIHQYKATLPNRKAFVRVYEIRASTTLYTLHLFLQNDLSFAPDQQVFFRSVDNEGKSLCEYGLFDMGHGSMDQVSLEVLHQEGVRVIQYVFDIFCGRYLMLQLEGIHEELPRKTYPRTVMEQGGGLEQFREEYPSLDLSLDEFNSE